MYRYVNLYLFDQLTAAQDISGMHQTMQENTRSLHWPKNGNTKLGTVIHSHQMFCECDSDDTVSIPGFFHFHGKIASMVLAVDCCVTCY